MRRRFLLATAALLSFSLIAAACGDSGGSTNADAPATTAAASGGSSAADVTAAWIYIGQPGDAGWTFAHDQGRLAAEAATGATTLTVENIAEGSPEFEQSVRDLISQGTNVIFATSFGYMDDMERLAGEFPEVKFIHATGFKSNDTNFTNYFGRVYQPRYLSGMIAGATTTSNTIGYVAAFPIPEVIRGINAFTLGAQVTNPDVKVQVNWTSTWFDPAVEGDAAQALIDAGADVIAMHQDSTAAGEVAEKAGARWVSYNSDMSAFAPNAYLTSAVWDWAPYYTKVIEDVAAGTWTPAPYWGGMEDGIVKLGSIASDVDSALVTQVNGLADQMAAGSFEPFTGPLLDQDGTEQVAAGVSMEAGAMLGMDWFVQGVEGSAAG